MSNSLRKYNDLRNEIDQLTEKLFTMHNAHVQCKKGCDLCCMDYDIFPVEFEAIKKGINHKKVDLQESVDGSCIFLKDHACQIYEHRPIICRTHGLPLLFMNDEQWELSACELNFTEFDDADFDPENTFPQDKFNSRLFMLNKAYIEEKKISNSVFELIPMNELKESINR